MILKNGDIEYQINDDAVTNPAEIIYVKEMPGLFIHYNVDGSLQKINGRLENLCIPHFSKEFSNGDDNVVAVNCFPPFPRSEQALDLILTYIRTFIKNENTKIIFENVHEGHVIAPLRGIYQIINILNLNPKNVYFFAGAMQARKLYDEYCNLNNITDKINIRVLNPWERHLHRHTTVPEPIYEIKNKEKLFLCFNRMARLHRVALLGLLYSKNLVEKSYYSFFLSMYNINSFDDIVGNLKHWVSTELFLKIFKNIKINEHKFPLKLNSISADDNVNYVKEDDYQYYQNSYFSIVTETFFFATKTMASTRMDELSVFFSEKVFKPIVCKHPFILLNRPYALEYLRKIGYKTFSPYINESYDLIENDEKRLLAVTEEIERLSKQTPEEWIEWQKNVQPIIEYNYKIFTSKTMKDHEYYE